jgi:hypothetical protein
MGNIQPYDGAMRRYTERYTYDKVSNFKQLWHRPADNGSLAWHRDYFYDGDDPEHPLSNRLRHTVVRGNGSGPETEPYTHDRHGNMIQMPHLAAWSGTVTTSCMSRIRRSTTAAPQDAGVHRGLSGQLKQALRWR